MNFRMGFFEVAKTSVRIGHSMPSQEFAVNKGKWDALPADLKAIVSSCVREWTWDQIQRMGFDERFRRLWRFYLAYCEAGFRSGRTDVIQIGLSAANGGD